ANTEGWGMYSEAIMKEHFPLEGQFATLRTRLMRLARAFLDPMVNLGLLEPHQAKQILMLAHLLSEPLASSEVDRYKHHHWAPRSRTHRCDGLQLRASLSDCSDERRGLFSTRSWHVAAITRERRQVARRPRSSQRGGLSRRLHCRRQHRRPKQGTALSLSWPPTQTDTKPECTESTSFA
ncbi:MAG: DUF885 family protein, partial [Pirellulaceae bacterium]